MLVCQIAKSELNDDTVQKVERLLAHFEKDFPESSTFITASCFADDITSMGLSGFKVWHGVLTPYCFDNTLSEKEIGIIETLVHGNNLHAAIHQAMKTLSNPAAKTWEKSFLLRFLLHCVADIHQPLHCIQLYSAQFPHGDLAGHRFTISGVPYKNLHLLWDSAFGIGDQRMKRPLSKVDEQWIYETAVSLKKAFPKASMTELTSKNHRDWSKESYKIAVDIAYKDIQMGRPLSKEYLTIGEQVASRQIVLAGYRLAQLLAELFND